MTSATSVNASHVPTEPTKVSLLDQSLFCEAEYSGAGDDQVIQHPHVHQGQRGFEGLGQRLVGAARLHRTTGVLG